MPLGFDVVISSRTALQFVTLASAAVDTLRGRGMDARLVEDELPPPGDERVALVIAPHDVYPHLEIHDESTLEASLSRTLLVCCERPSHPRWAEIVPYAARAAAVFDVSAAGVAALEEHRVPARRFQLGYHETLDRWRGRDTPRSIDVAFLGSATPRRLEVLAGAAPVFAGYDVDIRLTDDTSGDAQRRFDRSVGDDRLDVLSRSKLVLNVHRDEGLSFEWLRAVQAICNGCVFVTEEAVGAMPLEADVHFVTASREELPEVVDTLLRDERRLTEIRETAYGWVRAEARLEDAVARLVEAADIVPPRKLQGARRDAPAFPSDERSPENADTQTSEDVLREAAALITRQASVMKRLFFDLRLLRRQVAELELALNGGAESRVRITKTPAVEKSDPKVSVLVSLYNYEGYVRDAIESVLASEGVDLELVVVDDASIDGSAHAVRATMAAHPDAAITLLEQAVNTGVQRARNLGTSHVRAPYMFVLDADNLVFPHGIHKLAVALDADPHAAFAYGLIERFNHERPLGLMNTRPWDPELLAESHYIDAMALLRVDALREVGGYVTDPTLELGWEDYDLWLSFAGAGYRGVHVREIVGRYRVHGVSSLTITTLDTEDLKAKLYQRHAQFFESVRRRKD